MDARHLDLRLHLLDRQVVDADDRLVCKVDDLELDLDNDGRPYVKAIVVGPRAVGPRLGGRLGRWVTAIAGRISDGDGPPTIDFAEVTDIGSAVKVSRRRRELGVDPLEVWVDEHIIERIPGSGHASE
jgi:sporulation protein YlmC with PRC-barrel domain